MDKKANQVHTLTKKKIIVPNAKFPIWPQHPHLPANICHNYTNIKKKLYQPSKIQIKGRRKSNGVLSVDPPLLLTSHRPDLVHDIM